VANTQRIREAEIQSRKRESGLSRIDRNMASTTENAPKDATEDPKLDVFEDDDEFEEFENEGKGGKNLSHHWVSWEDSSFSQMVFSGRGLVLLFGRVEGYANLVFWGNI
jgi:hypothetical protein